MRTQSLPPQMSAARWDAYTLNALNEKHWASWLSAHWSFSLVLYARIMAAAPPGGRILEIGTGAGPHLLWLAAHGYETTGVEYRPKVVEEARRLAERLELDCRYEVGDAFALGEYRGFDVVFSTGLIEHWERDETVSLLREQSATARTVIATVPTPFTRYTGTITDERFFSLRELRALFRDAGLADVTSFGYGQVPNALGRIADLTLPRGALRLMQTKAGWLAAAYGATGRSPR